MVSSQGAKEHANSKRGHNDQVGQKGEIDNWAAAIAGRGGQSRKETVILNKRTLAGGSNNGGGADEFFAAAKGKGSVSEKDQKRKPLRLITFHVRKPRSCGRREKEEKS